MEQVLFFSSLFRSGNTRPATALAEARLSNTLVDFMSVRWHKYSDARAAAEACARHTIGLLTEMLSGQECATIAVSGGVTPGLYFDALAAARFRWDRVHL